MLNCVETSFQSSKEAPGFLPPKGFSHPLPFRGIVIPQNQTVNFELTLDTINDLLIHFVSGDVENQQEVFVFINNHHIGFLPQSSRPWAEQSTLFVGQEFLKSGVNKMMIKGYADSSWRLKDVYYEMASEADQMAYSPQFLVEAAWVLRAQRHSLNDSLQRMRSILRQLSMTKIEEENLKNQSTKLQEQLSLLW
ncbi:MAG: hypothetical protein KDD48_01025 [Bdellovibrionales bacterium]|nr:hypothetical protein [Bdellovibrionales bacterium]